MKFHQNPEYGLLSIRHFDDFVAAQSTTALVTINRLLSEYDRMALKHIIIDFERSDQQPYITLIVPYIASYTKIITVASGFKAISTLRRRKYSASDVIGKTRS
jgi:hypothetical protein